MKHKGIGVEVMVVYADVLVVLNLLVDYFLLILTARIAKIPHGTFRCILGALLGGISSLYIFLPPLPTVVEIASRILLCGLLCLVSFGFPSVKIYLRGVGVLLAVSFGYAGGMMALWTVFHPNGMVVNHSVVYFNISPLFLVLFSVLGYFSVLAFRYIFKRNGETAKRCDITVYLENRSLGLTGIADTGNSLTDVFGRSSVIVAQSAAVKSLFGEEVSPLTQQNRYRAVPCKTISGEELLEGYRCDRATVTWERGKTELNQPILAVSKTDLGGDYSALVNPEIFDN